MAQIVYVIEKQEHFPRDIMKELKTWIESTQYGLQIH